MKSRRIALLALPLGAQTVINLPTFTLSADAPHVQ